MEGERLAHWKNISDESADPRNSLLGSLSELFEIHSEKAVEAPEKWNEQVNGQSFHWYDFPNNRSDVLRMTALKPGPALSAGFWLVREVAECLGSGLPDVYDLHNAALEIFLTMT